MTKWIDELRAGDAAAAHKLWELFSPRLVELARKKLQDAPRLASHCHHAALVAEESGRLLARLDDAQLRTIAPYKLEGHTNDEISANLGYERITLQRKLRRIRQVWGEEVAP